MYDYKLEFVPIPRNVSTAQFAIYRFVSHFAYVCAPGKLAHIAGKHVIPRTFAPTSACSARIQRFHARKQHVLVVGAADAVVVGVVDLTTCLSACALLKYPSVRGQIHAQWNLCSAKSIGNEIRTLLVRMFSI